jgi:uncharacterized protein YjiS (DUF1127 family)
MTARFHPSEIPHTTARDQSVVRPLSFWRVIQDWLVLSRQRVGLSRLDDHLLRDIGATRHQAMTEAARPFWDAPDHWRDRPGNS